jgi:hypothetical protein
MSIPDILSEEVLLLFRANYNKKDDNNLQKTLTKLKEMGVSQMESVFLLIKELNFSFTKANLTILNSEAWNS